MKRPVHHLVYSNAPESGAAGYRVVARSPAWPKEHTRPLELWLRSLHGAPGPGMATASMRIGDTLYACLAVVLSSFGADAHGRPGGMVVHALGVAVDEDRDPGLHSTALVNLARGLHPPQVTMEERLRAYLVRIGSLTAVQILPPSLEAIAELGTEVIGTFLGAACTALCSPQGLTNPLALPLPDVHGRSPAEVMAAASGALPPRLRLALRWAVGLQPSSLVHLIISPSRTSDRGGSCSPDSGAATAYTSWLLGRLEEGQHDQVRTVLSDWRVRSWDELLRAIRNTNHRVTAGCPPS